MALDLLGGVGIFLLGMVLLTEGLRAMAGGALRRGLARFTGGRFSSVASGAAATALIQSSTATTLTAIGLVAAGLMPFRNAVGVVVGASLGTTSTAWIVAYFGLKLDISAIAMVAVAAGALMRLLGRDRISIAGLPIAGFGLLFVGIGLMQAAMAGVADEFTLPGETIAPFLRLLVLVVVGALMTIVMQSSSAAVATALTAVAAGAIGLEHAAALVIGQSIGTAPKALLASVGATAAARRTAMAHVVFNLGAGILAVAILPPFIWAARASAGDGPAHDPAMVLAAFHSLFNVVGIALVLPWLDAFTLFVSRLIKDRGPALSRFLSPAVASEPALSVEAARTTLLMCATEIGDAALVLATRGGPARELEAARSALQHVRGALDDAQTFLANVRTDPAEETEHRRHVSVLHALNHLQRAVGLLGRSAALDRFSRAPELGELREALRVALEAMVAWCPVLAPDGPADHLLEALGQIPPLRRRTRRRILRQVATGEADADTADETLESLVWAQAFGHHLLRAVHHMREPAPGDEA
jgi:phosphate:Na+ symporter